MLNGYPYIENGNVEPNYRKSEGFCLLLSVMQGHHIAKDMQTSTNLNLILYDYVLLNLIRLILCIEESCHAIILESWITLFSVRAFCKCPIMNGL